MSDTGHGRIGVVRRKAAPFYYPMTRAVLIIVIMVIVPVVVVMLKLYFIGGQNIAVRVVTPSASM